MSEQSLADDLAIAARELQAETDVSNTLEKAVALCVELIDGCEAAGVSVVHGKHIDTPVTTSDMVARGDALQYELAEGPCLDALSEHELVCSPDLAADHRWPKWGPRVTEELGVRSMLSVRLFVFDDDRLGALNMYSSKTDGFDDSDQAEALALSAHVAIALAAAQEIQQLNTSVTSRTVIGQAQGIMMERFDINADRAFAAMRRVSNNRNVKLQQVAAELVETRKTPGTEGNGPIPSQRVTPS